jgi:hypothetical protein
MISSANTQDLIELGWFGPEILLAFFYWSSNEKRTQEISQARPSLAPFTRGDQTCKQRGELAEIAFLPKAAHLGFGVAKPYGDSERYDFILDSGERPVWRVQVKSVATTYPCGSHGYRTASCHSRGSCKDLPYTANEINFFIAYIVPLDIWYVVPVKLVTPVLGMCFYPSDAGSAATTNPTAKPGFSWAPGGDLKPQPPIPIRVPPIGRPRKTL